MKVLRQGIILTWFLWIYSCQVECLSTIGGLPLTFVESYLKLNRFSSVNVIMTHSSEISLLEQKQIRMTLKYPIRFESADSPSDNMLSRMSSKQSLNVMFLDASVNGNLMEKIVNEELFRKLSWLLVGRPQDLVQADFSSPYLAIDNEVVFAEVMNNTSDSSSILLVEVYQPSPYLPKRYFSLGSWTQSKGLQMETEDKASRRTDLKGLHLRCVTLPYSPFLYTSKNQAGERVELLKGVLKDAFESMVEEFQFEYTCSLPADSEWGSFRNGKWTGLIKEIQDNTADIIVAPLSLTPLRQDAVQYLHGLKSSGFKMVVRRPSLMSSTWTSFTIELDKGSWAATILLVLLLPIFMAYISKHSPNEDNKISVPDAYVLTIGALSFQGSWLNVSSLSSRILFITIFFGTLLIYAHYTSALVAQLTVASEVSVYFSTLQGLLDDGGFEFGFMKGTALEDSFESSEVNPYKQLWDTKIMNDPTSLTSSEEEGIYKVKNEQYVYLIDEHGFDSTFASDCDVMTLKTRYFSSYIGFAVAKDSPYAEIFSFYLSRIHSSGHIERAWKKFKQSESPCEMVPFIALDINQMSTAFLVLLLGLIIACFVCFPFERFYKTKPNSSKIEVMTEQRSHVQQVDELNAFGKAANFGTMRWF